MSSFYKESRNPSYELQLEAQKIYLSLLEGKTEGVSRTFYQISREMHSYLIFVFSQHADQKVIKKIAGPYAPQNPLQMTPYFRSVLRRFAEIVTEFQQTAEECKKNHFNERAEGILLKKQQLIKRYVLFKSVMVQYNAELRELFSESDHLESSQEAIHVKEQFKLDATEPLTEVAQLPKVTNLLELYLVLLKEKTGPTIVEDE